MLKKYSLMTFATMAMILSWAANAETVISAGEYRFVVAETYTQIVDPGNPVVETEDFQGNQWAVGRINEIQKLNTETGLYDIIWTQGNVVPRPPEGNTNAYITAVVGGLTVQPDPMGIPAVNTGLGYNIRQHDATHPDDYANPSPYPVGDFPRDVYFVSDNNPRQDQLPPSGAAYLKLYGTDTNVFNAAVAEGIGTKGGAYNSFGTAIISDSSATLLLDAVFDADALFVGSILTPDSVASNGTKGELRARASSDVEAEVLVYFQTTGPLDIDIHGDGFGAWDFLFDSNSSDFFGADGQLDLTTRALIGSPYLPPQQGQNAAPQTAYGWDFIDSGQAVTNSPEPTEEATCRVTAGGVKDDPLDAITMPCELAPNGRDVNIETCALFNSSSVEDTWGGQAGAPPRVDGNWTHHHTQGEKNDQMTFLFHSNNLFDIMCSDPGPFCDPARFAPNRQIDFAGIGAFVNQKGYPTPDFKKGEDRCFEVHLEDIGEPGPGGRWPSAEGICEHEPGTPINNPEDCKNCTDYYEIRIYSDATNDGMNCLGDLIYTNGYLTDTAGAPDWPTAGYFTRSGNVQMHPDNNGP